MNALIAAIRKIIELWALAGGLLLLAVVMVNVVSLIGNIALARPVPGDFELVEMGVAIAVFAFLPYCQITGSNVTADIFTARAGPRTLALLMVAAAIVAFAVAVVLLWRMTAGLADLREYGEVTTIYQIPIWTAYVPILVSLFLLILASLISLIDAMRGEPAA
jgi:TRAP-type C4-dicarboxylate transport system permease small subunit